MDEKKIGELNFKNFKKIDILVHFAAAGVNEDKRNNIKEIFDVNIHQSRKMIINAIENKCKKFLIISSSSEFGDFNPKSEGVKKNDIKQPNCYYGLSKFLFNNIITKLSKQYKCKFRVMRLFPVYGEGEGKQRIYSSIKRLSYTKKIFF